MESEEEKLTDVSTGIAMEEDINVLNDDFMFYPILATSICSEIKVPSNSLQSLEERLCKNNHDQFIDLSYTS